jgi:hypothetical protein
MLILNLYSLFYAPVLFPGFEEKGISPSDMLLIAFNRAAFLPLYPIRKRGVCLLSGIEYANIATPLLLWLPVFP